jgi:hypothetical protein
VKIFPRFRQKRPLENELAVKPPTAPARRRARDGQGVSRYDGSIQQYKKELAKAVAQNNKG